MTVKNVAKDRYTCLNGPLEGTELLLASGGTLPLEIGGRRGTYKPLEIGSKNLVWHPEFVYTHNSHPNVK
jgi:hypothetical protein